MDYHDTALSSKYEQKKKIIIITPNFHAPRWILKIVSSYYLTQRETKSHAGLPRKSGIVE